MDPGKTSSINHFQKVVLYFFKFKKNRYWAFKQMRLAQDPLSRTEGLSFFKLLGCGSGNGFSLWPDFGTYALLTIWDDLDSLNAFENNPSVLSSYRNKSFSCRRFELHPVAGHGSWGGVQPFQYKEPMEGEYSWAVITRASIERTKLAEFWLKVPGVSKRVKGFPGAEFSVGIGELPLVEQATFSLWRDLDQMKSFAYGDRNHSEVVKLTRIKKWYSEELFARFQLLKTEQL